MSERLRQFINGLMNRGEKQLVEKLTVKETVHERVLSDTQNNLDRVRERIFHVVKDNVKDIDWNDKAAVDAFCAKIDAEVERNNAKFIKAVSHIRTKTGDKNPVERWQEFKVWLQDIRTHSKKEILAEIKTIEKEIEAEKMVEQKSVVDKIAQVARFQAEEERKIHEELEREEREKITVRQQIEVEKAKRIADVSKTNYERLGILAEEKGVPRNITESIELFSESMRVDGPEEAGYFVTAMLEQIASLEKAREAAERLWEGEAESSNALSQELSAAQEVLLQKVEQLEGVTEKIVDDVDRISGLEAEVQELRRQVGERDKQLILLRQDSTPSEVEAEYIEKVIDFSDDKERVSKELAKLDELEGDLQEYTQNLLGWVEEAQFTSHAFFSKKRLEATDEDSLNGLQIAQAKIIEFIERVSERRLQADRIFEEIEEKRRKLLSWQSALRLVEIGLQETIELPSITKVVPPDLSILLEDSLEQLEAPKKLAVKTLEVKLKSERVNRVEGIPYTVAFTNSEAEYFDKLIDEIQAYEDMPFEKIQKKFPFGPHDESIRENYYDPLIISLHEGTYLDNFKKALVILGAMRTGDTFTPRLAKTVGNVMTLKEVGMSRMLAKGGNPVVRSLYQTVMLQEHLPVKLVESVAIGSSHGKAYAATEAGQKLSQIWTKDLIDRKVVTPQLLTAMYEGIKRMDAASQENRLAEGVEKIKQKPVKRPKTGKSKT